MEEIRKILETLKNQMDESWEEYNTSLETSLASLKSALHNIPKLPAPRFELEKAVSMLSRLSQAPTAPAPTPAGGVDLTALRAALRRVDGGKTQVEILDLYLDEAAKYASRVALFIFKGEQAMGWKGMGFTRTGSDDTKIKSVVLPLSEGNPLHKVYQTKRSLLTEPLGEDILGRGFDGPRPNRVFLVPMVIRDKVSAALYADEVKGATDLNADALEILTFAASMGINLLGQRQILPCPTLSGPGPIKVEGARSLQPQAAAEAPAPPPPSPMAAVPITAPVSERTQKIDVSAMAELEALRRETLKKAHPVPEERPVPPPPEPPAPPEPKPMPPQLEETQVSEPSVPKAPAVRAPEPEEAPAAEPQYELEYAAEPSFAPEPTYAPEPEPAVEEPGFSVPESPAVSEWAAPEPEMEAHAPAPEPTVPMPAFQPQVQAPAATTILPAFVPAPRPPAAAPPPPAAVEEDISKRSVEVRPPMGFKKDKPGFGFDQVQAQPGMSVEEARKHDEARRFARLLVSEIKLYNEPKVDEGRKNKTVYNLLKEDIDRSKQIYEERIAAEVRSKSDYFRQALVSILANGDAAAMGNMG